MDMKEYYNEITREALQGFKRLNDTNQVEHKKWEVPMGSWEVWVVRGKVLEKAALAHICLEAKHPDTGELTRFDVLQSHVYPASPGIPILLFIVEHIAAREDKFAGILDVAPAGARAEDLNLLRDGIKNIVGRHGENYDSLRQKIENMYKLDQWKKAVNAGIGIFLGPGADQFELIKEAGKDWLKAYFTIVEKRAQESTDGEPATLMDSARARILEYCLIGEGSIQIATKHGIPLEAMTLGLLAPTIRY
jgi:coproporphyrinogen III oxidase